MPYLEITDNALSEIAEMEWTIWHGNGYGIDEKHVK